MILIPYGLFSWLLIGAITGVAAAYTLPEPARPGLAAAFLVGCFGAVLGGGLATALGFGGLVSFDTRSLIVATLAAMAVLVWWRVQSLAST